MPRPPLLGTVIGVTADRRGDEQTLLLQQAGAKVLAGPTIRTLPLADHHELEVATRRLLEDPPAVVVLTTGIGVRGWFSAAASMGLDRPLREAMSRSAVFARGPKAAGAALAQGLVLTASAESECSAEIVATIADRYRPGTRVAVQLDGSDRPWLVGALQRAGADVSGVRVYRWTRPVVLEPARRLIEAVAGGGLDGLTFTSSPALVNLMELAAHLDLRTEVRDAFNGTVATACVGPVCARTARDFGIEPVVVPERFRLGAMVEALAAHLADPPRVWIGDEQVWLRHTAVVAGDQVVELSERERAVLAVLAAKPGSVVSREKLSREVWPDGGADAHTVGVTIARLRRRLGRLGAGVETSHRRGYRLVATPGRQRCC